MNDYQEALPKSSTKKINYQAQYAYHAPARAAYQARRAQTYYAIYGEIEGTAELLNGTGYLFRAAGAPTALVVATGDPTLQLMGRCDLADAQRQADTAAGGLAAIACGRAY